MEGGGSRRNHLRALAQRVEVGAKDVRIIGSKGGLLCTLTAVSQGKSAALGVPGFGLKWRRERPKYYASLLFPEVRKAIEI